MKKPASTRMIGSTQKRSENSMEQSQVEPLSSRTGQVESCSCSAESQERERANATIEGTVVKEQDELALGVWTQHSLYKYGKSARQPGSLIIFSHLIFSLVSLVWSRVSCCWRSRRFHLQVFISSSSSREARPNLRKSYLSSKLSQYPKV